MVYKIFIRLFTLFLFCILFLLHSEGQEPQYIIKNYNFPNFNGAIWSISQDSLGYLYFGTGDGIVVYDGIKWEFVQIGYYTTRCIHEDSKGNLWYGSANDFGQIKKSEKRGIYTISLKSQIPLDEQNFGDIWTVHHIDDTIFFQSKNKIFLYNETTGLRPYKVEDTYHRAFTHNSMYIVNKKGEGLLCFIHNHFEHIKGGAFFKDKTISGSLSISKDTLLLGTRASGLFKFNIKTGQVFPAFEKHKESVQFLIHNKLYDMISLPDNNIGFATLFNGTLITDINGKKLKHLNTRSGTKDNKHYSLYLSKKDNNLWMCTNIGCSAIKYDSPLSWWNSSNGIEGVVLTIEDYKNCLLIGSSAGLFHFKNPYSNKPDIKNMLNSEIWGLYHLNKFLGHDCIIVCSSNGVYKFENNQLAPILNGELVLKAFQLNANEQILIAFTSNDLLIFNISQKGINYLGKISGLFNELCTVSQSGNKYIWIATRGNQIVRINQQEIISWVNNKKVKLHSKILNAGILTDVINYKETTYFANQKGLFTYNPQEDTLTLCDHFGNNILNLPEWITTLREDENGHIWLGGNRVLLYQPDGTYSLYMLPYDVIDNITSASIIKHADENKTWIGGEKGVFLFSRPVSPIKNSTLKVVIDKLVTSDSTYYLFNNKCNHDNAPISLGNNTEFSIYYSLPVFGNEEKISYSCFLDNYSKSWTQWDKTGNINFRNLNPGNYTFKVKAKTKLNQNTEITCLKIKIEKTWYQTTIALIAYFIIAILIIILLIKFYISRKFKRKLKMELIIQEKIKNNYLLEAKESGFGHSKKKDEDFFNRLIDCINENADKSDFNVNSLCQEMNMNQTLLYRKIKSGTGLSISAFIRMVRLKNAMHLLSNTDMTISEVAYKVGFNDPGYFSKCFTKEYGKPPSSFQ